MILPVEDPFCPDTVSGVMRGRTGPAVALACLVVLAGCGAFVGGSSSPDSETLTPVPVPGGGTATDAPVVTDGAPPRPPGLGPDGVVNVTRLAQAHDAYVANWSYRWELRYRVASEKPPVRSQNFSRQVLVGTDAFLVRSVNPGLDANQSLYVADGQGYLRTVQRNESTYDPVPLPRDHDDYAFADDMIREFVAGMRFEVTVVQRGGQSYYRLHAATEEGPEPFNSFRDETENYTVTAYVTPEGFVRMLTVGYTQSRGSVTEHVSIRYDYTGIGTTTVDGPAWISRMTPVPASTPNASTPTPNASTPTSSASASTADGS